MSNWPIEPRACSSVSEVLRVWIPPPLISLMSKLTNRLQQSYTPRKYGPNQDTTKAFRYAPLLVLIYRETRRTEITSHFCLASFWSLCSVELGNKKALKLIKITIWKLLLMVHNWEIKLINFCGYILLLLTLSF